MAAVAEILKAQNRSDKEPETTKTTITELIEEYRNIPRLQIL